MNKEQIKEHWYYWKYLPMTIKAIAGVKFIDWGIQMFESGEALPIVTETPEAASLFIIVLMGIFIIR